MKPPISAGSPTPGEAQGAWPGGPGLAWPRTSPRSPVPVAIGGRFVPRDETADWAERQTRLFEHLLCQPELVLFTPRSFVPFPSARAMRRRGLCGRLGGHRPNSSA